MAKKHLDNKVREFTNTEDQQIKEECIEKVISQKNLSVLTEAQKEAAIKMVQEDADSPLDETPIPRKFNRVPNLFRDMLRTYLNEAGLRRLVPFILRPLLLCWKKNGSLHLYCDYPQLNSKTRPDRLPLPSIQATLSSLGGRSYFSIFGKGKAYHHQKSHNTWLHLSSLGIILTPLSALWYNISSSLLPACYGKLSFMTIKISLLCNNECIKV